jgi:hypothetical protein
LPGKPIHTGEKSIQSSINRKCENGAAMKRIVLVAAITGLLVGIAMGLRYATPFMLGRTGLAVVAGLVLAIGITFLQKKK